MEREGGGWWTGVGGEVGAGGGVIVQQSRRTPGVQVVERGVSGVSAGQARGLAAGWLGGGFLAWSDKTLTPEPNQNSKASRVLLCCH